MIYRIELVHRSNEKKNSQKQHQLNRSNEKNGPLGSRLMQILAKFSKSQKLHKVRTLCTMIHYCCCKQLKPEAVSGQSKETALVIYLAFLAKVANLYYIIWTAFKNIGQILQQSLYLEPRRNSFKSKGKSKHLYILSWNTCNHSKGYISFCLNILCILLITKLYSILLPE